MTYSSILYNYFTIWNYKIFKALFLNTLDQHLRWVMKLIEWWEPMLKIQKRNFLGGSGVKTLGSQCRRLGFDPWSGT